ncbi:hypothetical protein OR604_18175 [Aeromonas caviae]|uniref:hypothetical protein n=1 Tax=Aeromonas caviae TaxID=648 RepID=UPI00224F24A8|nr:hypothetical protein [Aeromonas caviae]MCX4038113.1 hypothetical protein [Aeromonas caviae]
MNKKDKFLGGIIITAGLLICFALFLSGNARSADPEMTAFVKDIIPENAKEIDRIKIEDGGYKVCWEISGKSDCFMPILKSPQYNKKIDSIEGVLIYRKSLFSIYFGGLYVFVPEKVKTKVSSDEVRETLTHILLEISERIEESNKIQSTWSKGL